jgi:hypothetical protein
MHPAFAAIEFGPFEASFHRKVVDETFKLHLSDWLETVVLPQVVEQYVSTKGRLVARYDSDVNCGENSAVRNIYRLTFAFCRPSGDDTLDVDLKFDRSTGSFAPRRANLEVCLFTAWHRARAAEIEALCNRVALGEHVDGPCPQCGGPIRVSIYPTMHAASCTGGCFDFDRHFREGGLAHGHSFYRPRGSAR